MTLSTAPCEPFSRGQRAGPADLRCVAGTGRRRKWRFVLEGLEVAFGRRLASAATGRCAMTTLVPLPEQVPAAPALTVKFITQFIRLRKLCTPATTHPLG